MSEDKASIFLNQMSDPHFEYCSTVYWNPSSFGTCDTTVEVLLDFMALRNGDLP